MIIRKETQDKINLLAKSGAKKTIIEVLEDFKNIIADVRTEVLYGEDKNVRLGVIEVLGTIQNKIAQRKDDPLENKSEWA